MLRFYWRAGNCRAGNIILSDRIRPRLSVTVDKIKRIERQIMLRDYLSQKMRETDITAAQLSRKSGVLPASITRFLQGTRGLHPDSIEALALAFNESPLRWARIAAGDASALGDVAVVESSGKKSKKNNSDRQTVPVNDAIIADITYDLNQLTIEDLKRVKLVVASFVKKE